MIRIEYQQPKTTRAAVSATRARLIIKLFYWSLVTATLLFGLLAFIIWQATRGDADAEQWINGKRSDDLVMVRFNQAQKQALCRSHEVLTGLAQVFQMAGVNTPPMAVFEMYDLTVRLRSGREIHLTALVSRDKSEYMTLLLHEPTRETYVTFDLHGHAPETIGPLLEFLRARNSGAREF